MRNKAIAFVGDSLGRQQMQSLMCMLTLGKDDAPVTDVSASFGLLPLSNTSKQSRGSHAYRFDATNTTVMFKWSVSLARIQPLHPEDPATRSALHLDRPEEFLEAQLGALDALVVNSGHHWKGSRMEFYRFDLYVNGKPVEKRDPLRRMAVAYKAAMRNVVRWLDAAVAASPEKAVFFR